MSPPTFTTVTTIIELERPGQPGSGSPGQAMREMFERAISYISDLGHSISDITLTRVDDPFVEGEPIRRRHRVLLQGEPCFEVVVESTPWQDFRCIVTSTPRVIAWPEAKGGTP